MKDKALSVSVPVGHLTGPPGFTGIGVSVAVWRGPPGLYDKLLSSGASNEAMGDESAGTTRVAKVRNLLSSMLASTNRRAVDCLSTCAALV